MVCKSPKKFHSQLAGDETRVSLTILQYPKKGRSPELIKTKQKETKNVTDFIAR